ncbi:MULTISPECIES: DUF1826 domain-containing protein [Vibrio]|uniref:DUF1826 domain-containing protein n=1 Tax=Vibrio neptunius TaxID=170651 RepID=A0ABS3A7U7_9VIBR|nr:MULTISPECIES: DUF1826 domain-containing protein [Vibrio]MBN3495585.1 DUF1826 domain-containing protein [Vibrio neptunius]MBN3518053.1 DUF1826 domain-containing protein [Vibrio neptunius]MBN3552392.1 DUF1826 domain-containing protein [Vibrio neptunius]MBN3580428.1 DUF1826 domain-containing protein [Vibrio neptunius]MCH9874095.1 DUF1826 domain-containing protein [Vibrio neptunius]
MNAALAEQKIYSAELDVVTAPSFSSGKQPTVLADIYKDEVNIAIWQRQFEPSFIESVREFVDTNPSLSKSLTVSPESAMDDLVYATDGQAPQALLENIVQLVDMFCCLFELEQVGLRLATLGGAMCPRFHVDQVPCRLVTTYHGVATDWLPNHVLDRSKLGHGSNGQPDCSSGLYREESDVQQLSCGDVALLKGGRWEGNEATGLVHRSPSIESDQPRLLMTLDFG